MSQPPFQFLQRTHAVVRYIKELCARRYTAEGIQLQVETALGFSSEAISIVHDKVRLNQRVKDGKMTQKDADDWIKQDIDDLVPKFDEVSNSSCSWY